MKRILSILAVLAFALTAFAQQQPQNVTIDLNQLPESVRQQIEQQAAMRDTKAKVAQYGAWVGLGKELGSAIDGGLTAVEKHADNIANTKVGVFTMVLIAYKVIGTDVVQFVVGTLFAAIWIPVFIFFAYRNIVQRQVLKRVTYGADGKVTDRTYETVNEGVATGGEAFTYFFCFVVLVGATSLIIFAG